MVLAMYLGTIDVGGFAQWCEPDRSPVVELEAHCTCPTGTLAFSSVVLRASEQVAPQVRNQFTRNNHGPRGFTAVPT